MSLLPSFTIGIWNAWNLAFVFMLLMYIPIVTFRDFSKKMGQGEHYGKTEIGTEILVYILIIGSIFLPLKLGSPWFYSGIFIYLLGLLLLTATIIVVISTPLGKPFIRGVYHYSRNPGYLGQMMVFVGIGLASASWLYLLLSAILIFSTFSLISKEENVTLEKLGESYRDYMNKTPRWMGFPKSVKSK